MVTVWGGFIPPQVRRIAVKLNNRRTILVGLAFLSICTFWQMYDSVMTLILTDTFKLNETFAGAIMAADNVLALFLLPFFGALSDKTHTKIGRRMPFIVGGTAAAAVLMNLIPLLDDRYAANPSPATLVIFIVVLGLLLVAMGTYRSPAVALMPDVTPKPLRQCHHQSDGRRGRYPVSGSCGGAVPRLENPRAGACQLPPALPHRFAYHGHGCFDSLPDHQGA